VAFRPTIARGLALSATCLFNQPERCNLGANKAKGFTTITSMKSMGFRKEWNRKE
jgi:hypothetical protein